ncbi:hypothetical protein PtA15_8A268 [Puccinia triticina]|uniref:Uncharacterized protein n=1 Tax=Puccinia triticina TaxID=208348 RepID=A0ABY7CQ89_9BASI|nr:uncharacterized protein PtA15_8A268 [Puccinia triticina]WAQ87364.1 hypothetical protein PtA15_8A268 [Puccinia triticina]
MPNLNLTGIVASLRCLATPRTLLPTLHGRDIRCVDWKELRRKGYVGVVIDKDNCITKPYHDQLVPELQHAWQSCLATFGNSGVLLVGNSAGTAEDPSLIHAESVARHLGVPVLVHETKKPGQKVVKAIHKYFTADYRLVPVIYPSHSSMYGPRLPSRSRADPTPLKLMVIGDRVTTDIILASRLRAFLQTHQSSSNSSSGESNPVCSVLTQNIWQKEKLGTRFMRWAENRALKLVIQYSHQNSSMNGSEPSSSRKLPNLTLSPERISQTFEQSLSSAARTSQQPPSTIIQNVLVIVQDRIACQRDKLLARCRAVLIELTIASRRFMITTLAKLKNRAVDALVQSAHKLRLKLTPLEPLDPTSLGFKTPSFFQNLSKWKQLK